MISRRGFIGSVVALLAAPLGLLRGKEEFPPSHWRNYTARYTKLSEAEVRDLVKETLAKHKMCPPSEEEVRAYAKAKAANEERYKDIL